MKQMVAFVLAVITVIGGCATSRVGDTQKSQEGLPPGILVTILHEPDAGDVADCLRSEMQKVNPTLFFIPAKEFREALFPWFEVRTAPHSPEDLALVLNRPLVQEKVKRLGIRYLVYLTSATQVEKPIGCVVPTLGGCFGGATWRRHTSVSATVWDLKKAASPGTVRGEKSGTAGFATFVIPILFLPAMTEGAACREAAGELTGLLVKSDSETSKPVGVSPEVTPSQ